MNHIQRILIVVSVLQTGLCGHAQDLTYNEKIQLNKDAVELLMKYNETCRLNKKSYPAEFKQLFEKNADDFIFNDLMGLSDADSVSVKEYVTLLSKENVLSPDVTIKNVKNVRAWKRNSKHYLKLSFEKQMVYSNKSSGTILHSLNYYESPYQYEMTICSDQESGECYIVDLKSEIPNGKSRLPLDYTHVENTDPRDSAVTVSGTPLKFYNNQALVKRNAIFKYHDDDVKLNALTVGDKDNYHYVFEYKPKRWRVTANADISMASFFTVPESNLVNVKQYSKDFGIDVGYIFPTKNKLKFGIFLGVGMSLGSMQIAVDLWNYNYSAPGKADIDGDEYQRYVSIYDMLQQTEFKHITVPLYADIEYKFSNRVGIYANLGVKAYVNVESSAWDMAYASDVYGVYPQYGDLTIKEPLFNDFGTHNISSIGKWQTDLCPIGLDAIGGLGVRVRLFGPVLLNLGARYQFGIMPIIKSNGNVYPVYHGETTESKAPLVYQVEDGSTIRNLTNYTGDIFHNLLNLNVGITVKF